jgi:TATA-binding protein-associated factor
MSLAHIEKNGDEEEEEDEGDGHGEGERLPCLVVCPSSLAGHWYHEARRFFRAGALEPRLYCAATSQADRRAALRSGKGGAAATVVVVASYAMLRRDVEALAGTPWAYVVFDEGHVLRNEKSAVSRAARRLRAAHRLVLTGTPLQVSCRSSARCCCLTC